MHPRPDKQSFESRIAPYSNSRRPASSPPAKPVARRPPVGAAPAAIAPPISLRRTKPGEPAAEKGAAGGGSARPSTATTGRPLALRMDPAQGGTSARPSTATTGRPLALRMDTTKAAGSARPSTATTGRPLALRMDTTTAAGSARPSMATTGKPLALRMDPTQGGTAAGPSRARPQPQPLASSDGFKPSPNSLELGRPRPRPSFAAAGQTLPRAPVVAAGQTFPLPPVAAAGQTHPRPPVAAAGQTHPLPPVVAAGQTHPPPPSPKRGSTQEMFEGDEPALARQARERESGPQIRGRGRGGGMGRGRGRGRGGQMDWGMGRDRGTGRPTAVAGGYRKHAVNGLLKLADFAAWVLVEGRAVELHAVKAAGPMKMICYIVAPSPSPSSSPEFAVGFRDERLASASAADLLVECVVDGIPLPHDRQIIRAWKDENQWTDSKERARKRAFTWWGRRESTSSIRPFIFSPLRLTDDEDAACTSEAVLRSLGTIQLRIFRGRAGGAADPMSHDEFGAVEAPVFDESSQKVKGGAISHQAGLGPSRLEHQGVRSSFVMSPEDSVDKPYAIFEFVYRSRDVLELQGIVQPEARPATPPSPAPRYSSSANDRSRSPSPSVKPKPAPLARTESPALLMRNRRESNSGSFLTANGSTPKPQGVEVEVKEEPERKPAVRDRIQRDLGIVILPDSDDSSEDDDDPAGLKVEVLSPKVKAKSASSRGQGKGKGKGKAAAPALASAASAPLLASATASSRPPSGSAHPAFAEPLSADLEIARLRAEIAGYRAAELAALRAERDRAAAAAIAAQERRTPQAEEKRKRDGESDGERGEVERLLCGRSGGGVGTGAKRVKQEEGEKEAKGVRKEKGKDKGKSKGKSKGKGKGKVRAKDWEEMVLSDSSA